MMSLSNDGRNQSWHRGLRMHGTIAILFAMSTLLTIACSDDTTTPPAKDGASIADHTAMTDGASIADHTAMTDGASIADHTAMTDGASGELAVEDGITGDTATGDTTGDTTGEPGIVPNSVDQIWADMNEPNTGWVSNMPAGFGQFKGPWLQTLTSGGQTWDYLNMWIEVEAGGSGSGCSIDTNKATNTRVEIGTIRMYTLRNNKWRLFSQTKNTKTNGTGAIHPHPYVALSRGCGLDEYDVGKNFAHYALMSGVYGQRTNKDGFLEYRPDYYYRWHAWDRGGNMTPVSKLQAVFGTVYMRLVKDKVTGSDDRHLANYVAHIASDARANGGTVYRYDVGISRYKKITNKWVAFNFYSYYNHKPTKAEIAANPPPIVIKP